MQSCGKKFCSLSYYTTCKLLEPLPAQLSLGFSFPNVTDSDALSFIFLVKEKTERQNNQNLIALTVLKI
jgi:hypothetical protein